MKYITVLFMLISLFSCQGQAETTSVIELPELKASDSTPADSSQIDSTALGINFHPIGDYTSAKRKAHQLKQSQNLGKDFENYLLNDIIPHWYGTEWDFNGYTSTPNKGVIACGYFVSTTLLHAGLNINRYHLAQQAGLNEAKSLAITDDHYTTVYGIDKLVETMNNYGDGLYFVGLDNHVGYLYRKGNELYFIHSNYIEDKVMIEKALFAPAFQSNVYVIAELSTNKDFLAKWQSGETVKVYR